MRGAVWKTAIGNDLEISAATFDVALRKGTEETKTLGNDAFGGKVSVLVENTKSVFPDLKMFAPGSETGEEQPLHRDLVNVCLAYTSYRPDVDTLAGINVSIYTRCFDRMQSLIRFSILPASSF